ncbi:MAG: hypothetical protein HYY06_22295 [Deltaproteobacteria bacterium]|nr:hypothetical protein [Deltaproteobacteria bacterium]
MQPGRGGDGRAAGQWLASSWVVALAAAVVAAPLPAAANPRLVARAVSLYDAGQLTRALSTFEQALAAGDNDDAAKRTIYLHLGILRAGAGNAAGAEEEFSRLLALDPSATLPPDSSPVVTEPFERARAAFHQEADLDLEVEGAALEEHPDNPRVANDRTSSPRDTSVRSASILESPWFWGGAAAFVATAVLTTVWVTSDSGKPYLAVGGVESR